LVFLVCCWFGSAAIAAESACNSVSNQPRMWQRSVQIRTRLR
jgi:hypothetical protein